METGDFESISEAWRRSRKNNFMLQRMDDALNCLKGGKVFSISNLHGLLANRKRRSWSRKHCFQYTWRALKVQSNAIWVLWFTSHIRTNDRFLRHLKWNICLSYLDDILVFSETFDDHHLLLRTVQWSVCWKPRKLRSFTRESVGSDPEKVCSTNYPRPKNAHNVKSYLGLCSYYVFLIKNFSEKALPLQKLLHLEVKFMWSTVCKDLLLRTLNYDCLAKMPRRITYWCHRPCAWSCFRNSIT